VNFVRRNENSLVVGDSSPKRLDAMVEGYISRGYEKTDTKGSIPATDSYPAVSFLGLTKLS
jgi:hypothetical protein